MTILAGSQVSDRCPVGYLLQYLDNHEPQRFDCCTNPRPNMALNAAISIHSAGVLFNTNIVSQEL